MNEKWLDRVKNVFADTLIATPVGLLLGVLLTSFAKDMPVRLIVCCAVLIAIPILTIRWEKRAKEWLRTKQRMGFFLDRISTIPDGTEGDDVWNSWVLGMEALLRGRGLKRKFEVLRSVISRADPLDRPEIAENFLRGLAQESMDTPEGM